MDERTKDALLANRELLRQLIHERRSNGQLRSHLKDARQEIARLQNKIVQMRTDPSRSEALQLKHAQRQLAKLSQQSAIKHLSVEDWMDLLKVMGSVEE